jgi:hypothetical protein
MELIHYLNEHFFTRAQLLARCALEPDQLQQWQERRMMPRASYRLRLDILCDSFFGEHREQVAAEFYAKGCIAWAEVLRPLGSEGEAFAIFARHYRDRLDQLAASGLDYPDRLATDGHLAAEWAAFLDGTYGLCTVSGLPEDIAAKELAIVLIREADDRARLRRCVDLLDAVSSPFAPHEVARSSRHRYVDEMRRAHGL